MAGIRDAILNLTQGDRNAQIAAALRQPLPGGPQPAASGPFPWLATRRPRRATAGRWRSGDAALAMFNHPANAGSSPLKLIARVSVVGPGAMAVSALGRNSRGGGRVANVRSAEPDHPLSAPRRPERTPEARLNAELAGWQDRA
jgi:hypothetical protein